MMSAQLIFFTVPEDWPLFLDFFRKHSIKMIPFRSLTPDIELLDDVPLDNNGEPFRVGLTHPAIATTITREYIRQYEFYELDTEVSSVIEFDPGGFYGGNTRKLHQGRFYTVYDYYALRGKGDLVTKDEAFKKWVKSTYGKFKRSFLHKYEPSSFVSYTKNTIQWIEGNHSVLDGGSISLSIPGSDPSK